MTKHGIKIALCSGLAGMALYAGSAQAMSTQECGSLDSNQFLAAVERGSCRIDIQTAAGPDATDTGGNGGEHGGGNRGGGNEGGGGDGGSGGGGKTGGGRSTSGAPGAKP